MISHSASGETKRHALAMTLRAAMLNQPINVMLARHGGKLPATALSDWLRVADMAITVLVTSPQHPAIAPPRRADPMNVDVAKLAAAHFAHSPPGAVVKSDQDGMKFCNQCDRRVTAAFEAACKSKFCSFRK